MSKTSKDVFVRSLQPKIRSWARGFTPEQALLGKARNLPASLTSDNGVGAHALAESETPEGVHFRESLIRREQARRAFIQAER